MLATVVPETRGGIASAWNVARLPQDVFAESEIHFDEFTTTSRDVPRNGRRLPRWTPAVEQVQTDGDFIVRCELPGVPSENVVVSLSTTRVIIAGEKRDNEYAQLGRVRRLERRFGEFRRLISLPPGLDPGRATTSHRHGVLTVRIPWAADATARRVPIKKG